jgi:hypothetical protein
VMSTGVVRSAAVSGEVMRRFCRSAPRPGPPRDRTGHGQSRGG